MVPSILMKVVPMQTLKLIAYSESDERNRFLGLYKIETLSSKHAVTGIKNCLEQLLIPKK